MTVTSAWAPIRSYPVFRALGLDDADERRILRDNAVGLLGLPVTP